MPADVPWGPINSIADIFEDPHFAARENILRVVDERAGELALPARGAAADRDAGDLPPCRAGARRRYADNPE